MKKQNLRTNNPIIFIGYSGHAYVAIDIAISNNFAIQGYIDFDEKEANPFNINFLGKEEILLSDNYNQTELFVGIGDNGARKRIISSYEEKYKFSILDHPTSVISTYTEIGQGSMIASNAVINPLAKIGKGCIINTGSIIEHECIIGDFAHIAPGAVLAGNVKVGESSFIGANSVVKQGVTIGNNCIIGAGSVVLKDVPDDAMVVGNPGRIINVKDKK